MAWCGRASVLAEAEGRLRRGEPGRRSCKAKAATGRDELGGATVQPGTASSLYSCGGRAGATRRGFDAQRKTGGGGRPALMASQQVESMAEPT
jgi:hypothetical protein